MPLLVKNLHLLLFFPIENTKIIEAVSHNSPSACMDNAENHQRVVISSSQTQRFRNSIRRTRSPIRTDTEIE